VPLQEFARRHNECTKRTKIFPSLPHEFEALRRRPISIDIYSFIWFPTRLELGLFHRPFLQLSRPLKRTPFEREIE